MRGLLTLWQDRRARAREVSDLYALVDELFPSSRLDAEDTAARVRNTDTPVAA